MKLSPVTILLIVFPILLMSVNSCFLGGGDKNKNITEPVIDPLFTPEDAEFNYFRQDAPLPVEFGLPVQSNILIKINGDLGDTLLIIVDGLHSAGMYRYFWNPASLDDNVYAISLTAIPSDTAEDDIFEEKIFNLLTRTIPDSAQTFANEHFSEETYLQYEYNQAVDEGFSGTLEDWVTMDWEEKEPYLFFTEFSHCLPDEMNEVFYSYIGNYWPQFGPGWDDYDGYTTAGNIHLYLEMIGGIGGVYFNLFFLSISSHAITNPAAITPR